MVLNSQSPRPGARQLYMARRRRHRRWPWWLLAVLVVGFLGWRWLTAGSSDVAPTADAVASPTTQQESTAATQTQPPQQRVRTADLPPPRVATQASTPAPGSGGANTRADGASGRSTSSGSAPVTPLPPPTTSTVPDSRYTLAMNMIAEGRLIDGRAALSKLLLSEDQHLRPADAATARDTLTSINQQLIFGDQINENDPLTSQYVVQSGDALARIAASCKVPYQLLQQINHLSNPNNIHPGQKLKTINGPFHARVVKHEYRLDLYLKDKADQPIYIRSFPIGLGEGDSTPVGNWIIRRGGKVQNPSWTNPRTNEHFDKDNPKNPIGEYWIPLQGTDPTTENLGGYGIHGTIDPESIGGQYSMGCVRLRDKDIEQLFNILQDGQSTVQIVP